MIRVIPDIVDHAADAVPDQVAFRCRDQSITYAELVERSDRLAFALQEHGLNPGDRVGIYLSKCLECAVAIYGIQKAGGGYVPLDPAAPFARLNYILRDCGIRHLISESSKQRMLNRLVADHNDLTCIVGASGADDLDASTQLSKVAWLSWQDVASASPPTRAISANPDTLAYIIYTSGSTGTPKGIMHTHASGLSYARMAADLYGLHGEDTLSNFPPLHFDQSTFDYFSGPLAQATTVLIPEDYQLMPASLSELMAEERITVWYSVPFALIQLLLHGALDKRDLHALRWVIYGGEPFPLKHLKALMDLWPHARFSNCYGPAETNQCTYYDVPRLTPQDIEANKSIPIGYVCPGMLGKIVDDADRVVATGEPGELLIHSPTTMLGYWNRADLNAGAFYYDDTTDGRRTFYRTGDLVVENQHGALEFLGRKDRQIKSRGYRIELDEIETVLLSHPAIEEVAVFPIEDDDHVQIHAALRLTPGTDMGVPEIRRHAAKHLPRYAVPTSIGIVDDFPRTTSGKIDRRALQMAKS